MTEAKIDGAALLDEVSAWFARYVFTVSPAEHDLFAVWTAHTHVAVECYTTPRLQIDSAIPGSGKTTALEHLQRLSFEPITMAAVSSPALLTRMLDKGLRTILIDEADRSLNPDKDGVDELLAVLNSGYKRGATRPVLVPVKGGGWDPAEMSTFAPVAIAGNNPSLPDDTRTRMIRVLLLPDLDGTVDESDWELIEDQALNLATRLAGWADQIREYVRTHRPDLPAGITGRFREKWGPLRRLADAAGGRWPGVVDAMAIQDKEQFEMDEDDGLIRNRAHLLLLQDIHRFWPDSEDYMPSKDLAAALVEGNPDYWGAASAYGKELTVQRMGRMVAAHFKINTTRRQNTGARGYYRYQFTMAWRHLGVAASATPPPGTGGTGSSGSTGSQNAGSAGSAGSTGSTGGTLPDRRAHEDSEGSTRTGVNSSEPSEEPSRREPTLTGACEQCGAEVPAHHVLCSRCVQDLTDRARKTS